MIIKVTEFIRIDIGVCQSQPLFFDSPFTPPDGRMQTYHLCYCCALPVHAVNLIYARNCFLF